MSLNQLFNKEIKMEIDKLGEVNIDGRILNLDEISLASCYDEIEKIKKQKDDIISQINNLLKEI